MSFPDGAAEWSSGNPAPTHLAVSLERSVQTPQNHTMRFAYVTDPADPAGLTREVSFEVSAGFDHPRNRTLEAILIAVMLVLLLVFIWAWLYGINRIAGRIRRPRRGRYATFRVGEDWRLIADLNEANLGRPRHSPARLAAGNLRAVRKTPWRPWKPPYVQLSLSGQRFVGRVGSGHEATEMAGRASDLRSERRLHDPIVVVDVSGPAPYPGVVLAPIDPSTPTGEQLSRYIHDALRSIPRPEEGAPDG